MKFSIVSVLLAATGCYALPASSEEFSLEKRTGPGIVAAAESQKGKPYVWGGGGCSGPTKGGFDCSGLTQYAVCKAQGKTIPRTAQTQYHSSMGKHIPRAQAQPGDMLFWATGGDCKNKVVHVGIFTKPGWMVNAAHTGTPVRDQAIWTSSGGESICPDAVRFW
ncbi:putative endopeptidase p60 [Cladobotryum mycophilum]|uniref:Endopeptidase p60 n=1 Tax=Cladobotryum mycophilum TaxID=491253 RepID=A0ABR0T3Z9_9HYPO